MLRRIYDWVLSWAETPYGTAALAILAFAESSFFPIPPDVLLIALAIGQRRRSFHFALVCSVASLAGGAFGYAIGHQFWSVAGNLFFHYVPGFTHERFAQLQELYQQYDFMIVFTAGFTFIPYKLFTISSGVFNISFPGFLLASAVSRTARFFLISALIWKFGEPIKRFIEKYFNLLASVFVVLLIVGFLLLKYVI